MKNSKQFATIKELEAWLNKEEDNLFDANSNPFEAMFSRGCETNAETLARKLENEGYDLDNLVADGHAYDFAGHTNNGWIWEDEADLEAIKETGSNVELRKRG